MLRVSFRWRLAAPAILDPLVVTSSWICYRALGARNQATFEAHAANRIPATVGTIDLQPDFAPSRSSRAGPRSLSLRGRSSDPPVFRHPRSLSGAHALKAVA